MAEQESPEGSRRQQPTGDDEDGHEAAVAAVAAHLAELNEADRDRDDELWNEISSDGIEVEIGATTWELWFDQYGLWFDQYGWTAARPTYEPNNPGNSKGIGGGD